MLKKGLLEMGNVEEEGEGLGGARLWWAGWRGWGMA
jgi:hypothetical protein